MKTSHYILLILVISCATSMQAQGDLEVDGDLIVNAKTHVS